MALNIRKVVAQRAENNQKFIKRQFLYYFNRNCLFTIKNFMSRTPFLLLIAVPILFSTIFLLSSLLSCCFVSCSTPSGSRSFALPFLDYSLHLQYIRYPHSIVRTHSHHYLLKPELVQILLGIIINIITIT